jgi:hypothetical protein
LNKRALTEERERLLAASAEEVSVKARPVTGPPRAEPAARPKGKQPETHTSASVNDKLAKFARSLDQLAQHRIFQWSTDYRQQLSSYFDWFFGVTDRATPRRGPPTADRPPFPGDLPEGVRLPSGAERDR